MQTKQFGSLNSTLMKCSEELIRKEKQYQVRGIITEGSDFITMNLRGDALNEIKVAFLMTENKLPKWINPHEYGYCFLENKYDLSKSFFICQVDTENNILDSKHYSHYSDFITEEYIWYASYGSNIAEERFLNYIQGGQPIGASRNYKGCKNKSLPLDKEEIYINSELYFAKSSKTWENGGVGFIKINFEPRQQTLGKMYLITKEQLIDVIKQENNSDNEIHIDLEKTITDGSTIFKNDAWYGNIVYLGKQGNFPIFTFTHQINISETTKPSESYLRTIIKGIKETYDLSDLEITEYFISKSGITNNYTREDLIRIISSVDNQL